MNEDRPTAPAPAPTEGSRLRQRFGTVVSAFRRQGLTGAFVAVAGRLPNRLVAVEWYELREIAMPGDPTAAPWPEVRRAGVGDVGDLVAVGHVSDEDARARLAAGDVAYLGTDGGVPVAYVWFRAGRWREGDVEYVLGDDELWGYDLFVSPAHRGRRIAPALMVAAAEGLHRGGISRTLAVIDYLNEASRRAARHYDGRPVTACATLAVGGLVALRERPAGGGRAAWAVARRGPGIVRTTPTAGRSDPPAGADDVAATSPSASMP